MRGWGRLSWLVALLLGGATLGIFLLFETDVNPWDRFTWLMAATLAISAVVIFAFFVRDARDVLRGRGAGEDPASESGDSGPAER